MHAPGFDREKALQVAGEMIAANPGAIQPRLERAHLLEELGRQEEAREAYLELIRIAPTDFDALNNLANLLDRTGFRRAARLTYAEAIKWHPDKAIAYVNLGNTYLETDEVDAAQNQYEMALQLDPGLPEAHQGMSYVFERLGQEEKAKAHREAGFRERALTALPYRGACSPIPALLLVSARGGNIRTNEFLDDSIFATSRIFTEFFSPEVSLPPHALIFNAIADADLCVSALEAACELVARSSAPTINPPSLVLQTERIACAQLLGDISGVVAPKMALLSRAELLERGASSIENLGLQYPVLLRTPGHHTGRHFEMVRDSDRLSSVVESLPGERLLAIEHLEARRVDGKVRKYRVMIVDGKLYPLHAAISSSWKVHFFSADMSERPEHRAEDERFLCEMPAVLGSRAMASLERIGKTLGLDYAGVDFGLSERGDLLLFEANAVMIVPPPDPDPKWAYRRPHVERILAAVRTMLLERSGSGYNR